MRSLVAGSDITAYRSGLAGHKTGMTTPTYVRCDLYSGKYGTCLCARVHVFMCVYLRVHA